jgi:acetyl-CoA acetyltransferase
VAAIRDAGMRAEDIDGVCGSTFSDVEMQYALGLPAVTWGVSVRIPFGFQIVEAMNAIISGACTSVLVYHSTYRASSQREDAVSPVRTAAAGLGAHSVVPWPVRAVFPVPTPGLLSGGVGYASWTSRYLHEFGGSREHLGRVAINGRTNARANPNAVKRDRITMDDYLGARMIRAPLGLLDMDIPVDGAEAFVLTSADRAVDSPQTPVLIHAASIGRTARCREDQVSGLDATGQHVAVRAMWDRSSLTLDDVDVVYPYDGFTIMSLWWLESVGYCGLGDAPGLIDDSWVPDEERLLIRGRVPVNTHGGQLSEGALQGANAFREAVVQLRGEAGNRQVPGAEVALVTPGGIVWNAAAALLRRGG